MSNRDRELAEDMGVDTTTYTVHGGDWAELLADLRRQVRDDADVVGIGLVARLLRVSPATVYRMGLRADRVTECRRIRDDATECHEKS